MYVQAARRHIGLTPLTCRVAKCMWTQLFEIDTIYTRGHTQLNSERSRPLSLPFADPLVMFVELTVRGSGRPIRATSIWYDMTCSRKRGASRGLTSIVWWLVASDEPSWHQFTWHSWIAVSSVRRSLPSGLSTVRQAYWQAILIGIIHCAYGSHTHTARSADESTSRYKCLIGDTLIIPLSHSYLLLIL